jgi:hypothetical protein
MQPFVAWSYDLLDDAERALLRRLSVFAGRVHPDAVEHGCTGDVVDRYAVLDLLTHLVDKSLVQADVDDPEGRYRLLDDPVLRCCPPGRVGGLHGTCTTESTTRSLSVSGKSVSSFCRDARILDWRV